MMGKSALFSFLFSIIDLIIYFLIYVIITILTKPFGLTEILAGSALAVFLRIIYFQIPVQLILLGVVRYKIWHENIAIVAAACTLAFFLSSLYFLKHISGFLKYFTFSIELNVVGPGLILLSSVLLTWLIIFKTKLGVNFLLKN